MEQPKDYELKRDEVITDFTHREIIHLRLFTVGAFLLGVLAGAVMF